MRDPIPPPSLLVQASKSFADKLSLTTLPYHVHEILLGFLGYHFILHVLSPTISQLVCPKVYNGFNKRTRLNWDIHWVSMIQAVFICAAALWVIFKDEQRHEMDAIGALAVTCIGFVSCALTNVSHMLTTFQKPFGNYYGLSFVLYELSTPFLNIHWFCDKLNMTGSKLQLYNGIALLVMFFCCRIVWGSYQSIMIYSDIYKALTMPKSELMSSLLEAQKSELPMWLVCVYLVGNTALSMLNFYWFSQMIKAVQKRFVPADEKKVKKSQ